MRLKQSLTIKSNFRPPSGGTASTGGKRDEGGPLASRNQTARAGGARQSCPIAHVGEGQLRFKTSAVLRLDPLMEKARGVPAPEFLS